MSAITTQFREAVIKAVGDAKKTWDFPKSDFAIKRAYIPELSVQTIPEQGVLYVISLAFSDPNKLTRTNLVLRELPIMLVYMVKCLPDDVVRLDTLVAITENLMEVCRKDVQGLIKGSHWVRTMSMETEENSPMLFTGLREGNFFEAHFVTYYHIPVK